MSTTSTHAKANTTMTTSTASTITTTTTTTTMRSTSTSTRTRTRPSTKTETTTNLFQFLAIITACIACYCNSTQCGLVFDDITAIRDNKDLRPTTPWRNIVLNDFWGTPMRKEQSHKSYRPLTVLTFRFNYWLHTVEPFGYHVVNVILHILVCLLWRRVSRQLLLQCADSKFKNSGETPAPTATITTAAATTTTAVGAITTNGRRDCSGNSIQMHQFANSCSFIAALLFAVHPVHTEAVTGVVGRAELLSSVFYLLAFIVYASAVQYGASTASSTSAHRNASRRTAWLKLFFGFAICLLASMLSKEQGITVAGICAAYEIFVVQQLSPLDLWNYVLKFFEDKKFIASPRNHKISSTNSNHFTATLVKRVGFLVLTTLAMLIGRVYIMGSQLPVFTKFDNPASAAETPVRQLTYSYLIYLNSWLLLYPCNLCCDWTMGTIPLIEGFTDVRNLATLATFGVLAALITQACRTHNVTQSRVILMCLTWIALPFLPASNLFFPVGFVVAERILYMPSMGFCLLIAYGYKCLQNYNNNSSTISKHITKLMLTLLLVTHGIKTYERNEDWRTEYTLFTSGVRVNERNAKLFNNVGHALENEGRFHEALEYFQQAVVIQPDDIGAHINVGRTYNNLKMFHEAEMAYLKAKALFPKIKPGETYLARIAPNHLNVFINLANLISKNQTRLEEADFLYRQAISMRADYVQAYINRGDILMKLNRTAQAQEVYEKALLYDSDNADIYYNLGVVFLEQGKSAQAHVYFNKAIEILPEHEQALLNSAILLQEMGGDDARKLARERLYAVLAKDANNEKVYFNLGMLAMDESNFDEAEQFFKRAIHLRDNFRSALFNLALLLADANRPLDAVPFLNQLIRHHPEHIKGLILLGDIYINHIKDLDAAETCYRKILKHDPHNVQSMHNLCVVFVERKHLARAAACLNYTHRLAPTEDYILRHLEIVQTRLRKIAQLPESSEERQIAFSAYDPAEFRLSTEEGKQTTKAKSMQVNAKQQKTL